MWTLQVEVHSVLDSSIHIAHAKEGWACRHYPRNPPDAPVSLLGFEMHGLVPLDSSGHTSSFRPSRASG